MRRLTLCSKCSFGHENQKTYGGDVRGMTKYGMRGVLTRESVLAECEAKIRACKGGPPGGSREWDRNIKSPSRHTVKKYCCMTIEEVLAHFGYEAKYKSYHPKWTKEEILSSALQ